MEDDCPYELAVARLCGHTIVSDEALTAIVSAALRRHQVPSGRISVVLVDDGRISELNEAHLNHSGPTDVLSFDLRDDPSDPLEGEIVISADTAAREAQRRDHSVEAEVCLYLMHGLLHLLGYNDEDESEASGMHEMEDELLSALGYGPVYGARAK